MKMKKAYETWQEQKEVIKIIIEAQEKTIKRYIEENKDKFEEKEVGILSGNLPGPRIKMKLISSYQDDIFYHQGVYYRKQWRRHSSRIGLPVVSKIYEPDLRRLFSDEGFVRNLLNPLQFGL